MRQKKHKFIPVAEPGFSGNEEKYLLECIRSGWVSSLGEFVTKFGTEFAKYCGTKYGLPTSSGTAALHLALLALGIGPGDEVIVPALTFVATANVVTFVGATPVFVDSEEDTWNIDPEEVEKAISPKTKAIIAVHLYGHPARMDEIMKIAKKNKLFVIEDAAEAHGTEYKGKKVGGTGHIGAFSFYGNKTMTTGEGGMLVTRNKLWVRKAKLYRDQGLRSDLRARQHYWHTVVGYNYAMTNIQAAVGLAQLEQIDRFIKLKRRNARLYNRLLKRVPGVELPPEKSWAKNTYWMYSVLVGPEYGMSRNELRKRLLEKGIQTRPLFYPITSLPPYKKHFRKKAFPVARKLFNQGVNLPSGTPLRTIDIKRVASEIQKFAQK